MDRYATGTSGDGSDSEGGPDSEDETEPGESGNLADRILAAAPEWFVTLGSGSLATATLIALAATLYVGYAFSQGDYFGYSRTSIMVAGLQLAFATVVQAAAVYFAWHRRHWTFVMLACLLGSILIVTLPFTATAFFTLGLSQRQFRTTSWGFLGDE